MEEIDIARRFAKCPGWWITASAHEPQALLIACVVACATYSAPGQRIEITRGSFAKITGLHMVSISKAIRKAQSLGMVVVYRDSGRRSSYEAIYERKTNSETATGNETATGSATDTGVVAGPCGDAQEPLAGSRGNATALRSILDNRDRTSSRRKRRARGSRPSEEEIGTYRVRDAFRSVLEAYNVNVGITLEDWRKQNYAAAAALFRAGHAPEQVRRWAELLYSDPSFTLYRNGRLDTLVKAIPRLSTVAAPPAVDPELDRRFDIQEAV